MGDFVSYIKGYKRRNYRNIVYWLVLIILLGFIIVNIFSVKLKSDNEDQVVDEKVLIESASNNIVGVSSNNVTWGSGVIVSKEGYVLTNEHVSKSDGDCYVILNYNEKVRSNIVWSNSALDLAILKVNRKFNECAIFGESDELTLGERVFAIGNPVGMDFQKSVSCGIVSGLNRNLEFEENGTTFYLNNLIQTDATINPGNSGGALINDMGQIVGINTIKITSAEGMGFAVPINIVKPIIDKLENTGKFVEPSIGVWGYDKYSIGKLNIGISLQRGIYIGQVDVNGASERSGVKVGDIILKIDEKELNTISDLRRYIYEKNPGDYVKLRIKRDNSEHDINVKLE